MKIHGLEKGLSTPSSSKRTPREARALTIRYRYEGLMDKCGGY